MTTDKPPVILIRIKGNSTSQKLARKTKKSWVDRGYKVEYFDAITPDDFDQYNYLDFGDEFLSHHSKTKRQHELVYRYIKWSPIKHPDGNWYKRKITPTEKAVYYSHLEVFKLISKRKIPHIVIEHDSFLEEDLPSIEDFEFKSFAGPILWAYYITPHITDKLLNFVDEYNLLLKLKWVRHKELKGQSIFPDWAAGKIRLYNADGFVYRVLVHFLVSDFDNLGKKLSFQAIGFEKSPFLKSVLEENPDLYNPRGYIRDISDPKKTTIEHDDLVKVPKVAVLVNGSYHDYLDTEFLKKNIRNIQNVFFDCDVYWQCWDTPDQRKIMRETGVSKKIKIRWQDPKWGEPEYDPYELVKKEASDADATHYILDLDRVSSPGVKRRRKFAAHQILQTDVQLKSIENIKDYDYVIRTRWDVVLNKDMSVSELETYARDYVVGICCGHEIFRFKKQQTWYPHKNRSYRYSSYVWWKVEAEYRQWIVDNGFYTVNTSDMPRDLHWQLVGENRYHRWLNDPVIMFKPSDWKGDACQMWLDKKLYPAEYGFYQVLCRKRHHVNVQGMASIKRMCDSSPNAWYKYHQTYASPERAKEFRDKLKNVWNGDVNNVLKDEEEL